MPDETAAVGLLASGGLDSSVLLDLLVAQDQAVQPFYVECGLVWQQAERAALETYLQARASPRLRPLVVLELPLADVYGGHWSITGVDVPGAETSDESVFLPGRNALLVIKAALWCQLYGIRQLALGTLATNPFADAGEGFFREIESALNRGSSARLSLVRPLSTWTKHEVMQRGAALPLELTFSCIAPARGLHCGGCNKCAERRAAFALVGRIDPTNYATTGNLQPSIAAGGRKH